MNVSIVIPSYYRVHDLTRCIEALRRQVSLPSEVVIVIRDSDLDTWNFCNALEEDLFQVNLVSVSAPGVIAAMNRGLESAEGEIIAFTDDDAAPHPDWITRLVDQFSQDSEIGGVGGRDWVYHGDRLEDGAQNVVGKLHWFGRITGNHHIGSGSAREVDVLKGVNMSFRKEAIRSLRFDDRMRGTGAQVHFEIMFSLKVRACGWKLIYDPLIGVDHFRGERFDEDQRDSFNQVAYENAVHNETLALLENLPPMRRSIFLLWCILIGAREGLGLAQWLRFFPTQGTLATRKYLASIQGRREGYATWISSGQNI